MEGAVEGSQQQQDEAFMGEAINEGRKALSKGEVPVGCVFVVDGQVIGRGSNETVESKNATRHAEFVAIDSIVDANGGDSSVLAKATLYVTVEPCIMCAGALHLLK